MRWMIDTNVILDVLLKRENFYASSRAVLSLCEKRQAQGFVSASAVTDIFYLTRKALGSLEDTYKVVGALLDVVNVLTVTNEDVITAFRQNAKDFEDCLLATCAKSNACDCIVTRNQKNFLPFGMPLYSPEEILPLFEQE